MDLKQEEVKFLTPMKITSPAMSTPMMLSPLLPLMATPQSPTETRPLLSPMPMTNLPPPLQPVQPITPPSNSSTPPGETPLIVLPPPEEKSPIILPTPVVHLSSFVQDVKEQKSTVAKITIKQQCSRQPWNTPEQEYRMYKAVATSKKEIDDLLARLPHSDASEQGAQQAVRWFIDQNLETQDLVISKPFYTETKTVQCIVYVEPLN